MAGDTTGGRRSASGRLSVPEAARALGLEEDVLVELMREAGVSLEGPREAWLLDAAEYRFPVLQRLMRHRQTPLIHKGRLIRRNMRRELVTEQELMAALRGQGIDDPSDVDSACLEADGEISVIPFDHR